jgi:outer membrane protein assembly factor BamE (lipoprotein component of BamABCDE complex)
MRQCHKNYLSWLLGISLALLFSACATVATVDDFSKIKPKMSKDDVLEAVGSPNRTERVEGKEKWAYRFWTGPDKDVPVLKQVTFYNGEVVSSGDDLDEIKRLKDISDADEKRAEQHKLMKNNPPPIQSAPAASDQPAPVSAGAKAVVDEEPKPENESEFIEMRGRKGAVKSGDSEEQ